MSELPEGIEWVKPGQSTPFMQGMALNELIGRYKKASRAGWVLARIEDGEDVCLYILDGLKTKDDDGIVKRVAVAFKENGDNIEGYAIYWPEDDEPELGKQYALTGTSDAKCKMNGDSWAESEVKS